MQEDAELVLGRNQRNKFIIKINKSGIKGGTNYEFDKIES